MQCCMTKEAFVRSALVCVAAASLIALPAAAGSGAGGLREELQLGDLELSMDVRTSAARLAEERSRGFAASWKDLFTLAGRLDADTPFTLKFDAQVIDRRRLAGEELDAARLGSFDDWERRTVGDANLKLGLFDDRLEFTSRLGWSRTLEAPTDLGTLVAADLAAFDDLEGSSGRMDLAFFQRLDATLWRSDDFKLKVFGAWGRVGEDFRTLRESNRNDKDFFDQSNRSLLRGGAKLSAGPIGLALSHSSFTRDIHLEPEERRGSNINKAEVEFSLDEMAPLLSQKPRLGVFRWLPSSITLSGAMGSLEPDADAKVTDSVSDASVGLWWYRERWSVGASVWRSNLDSRQPHAEDADWSSSGAELSFSVYGDRWDVSGTAGLGRTLNQEEVTRSAGFDLQGSLTVGLRPEWLPDLTGTLSLNRTSTDYIAYATASFDDYWEMSAAADFSKFLPRNGDSKPYLRLIYSYSRWSGDDGFDHVSRQADNAVLLRLGFGF
jgi:hypothetical protein